MKRSLPRQDFAPLSLLLKILELQAAYYATAAVAMLFTCALSGRALDLSLVVSAEPVRGDTAVGWTLGVVWVLVGWTMAAAQLLIHARTKLVLDFSLTLHAAHVVVASLYDGRIPSQLLWWVVQLCSVVGMVAIATYACRWWELRPIAFGDVELAEIGAGRSGGGGGGGGGRGRGRGEGSGGGAGEGLV